MSFWVAAAYDEIIAPAEALGLRAWRREMLAPLRGRVLELGAGTGKNLIHYAADLSELILTEPDPHMRKRLHSRLQQLPIADRTTVSPSPAERLPFDSARFDQVVATLVFCSVRELRGSLIETHRVLATGGKLTLIEHVAAPLGSLQRTWQTRLDPIWSSVMGGCHLNRDPRPLLRELGFREERVSINELRGVPTFQKRLLRGTWIKT